MPHPPTPDLILNTRRVFQPHELSGKRIKLEPGGQIVVQGTESDLTLKGRLRHGVIRDCVLDCRAAEPQVAALVLRNTADCLIDNLTIIGGGVRISDAWNLNMTNCTVMNAWQFSKATVPAPRPGVLINSSAQSFRTNDVMIVNSRLEATYGPVLSANNVALLLLDGCKLHGTGRRRPRKYEGPLVKLKNCQGTQIRAAFAHANVTPTEGIVEIDGDRDCTTRIEGIRQSNCSGPTVKNRTSSNVKVSVLEPN